VSSVAMRERAVMDILMESIEETLVAIGWSLTPDNSHHSAFDSA
jgi:hypothetical protein